jgi:UDP-N-acetylmuramoyl-tripeptide--D-alanyl-D-alanine ligase
MTAALNNFFALTPGVNKMVILGDMFELGDAADREHQAVVSRIATHLGVESIVVGSHFAKAAEGTPIKAFETTKDLKEWLLQQRVSGMTILLKGSRGMKLEELRDAL